MKLLNTSENNVHELFDKNMCKLMNLCSRHMCHNPTCYKLNVDASKKLYRYGFPQTLVDKTHFDNDTKLLHIKRTYKWLNNANTWILSTSRCNHDVKLIIDSRKDNKSLIYYITNINLHNAHVFIFTNCTTKNINN